MTNRHHIPVTLITTDNVSKEDARLYVDRIVRNLTQHDEVERAFVEEDGIDDSEVYRLFDMIEKFEEAETEDMREFIERFDRQDD